jgi:hypothetical protein
LLFYFRLGFCFLFTCKTSSLITVKYLFLYPVTGALCDNLSSDFRLESTSGHFILVSRLTNEDIQFRIILLCWRVQLELLSLNLETHILFDSCYMIWIVMQEQLYKQYCIALSWRGYFLYHCLMLLSYGDRVTGGDGTWYQSHGSVRIPFVLKEVQLTTSS